MCTHCLLPFCGNFVFRIWLCGPVCVICIAEDNESDTNYANWSNVRHAKISCLPCKYLLHNKYYDKQPVTVPQSMKGDKREKTGVGTLSM